MTAKQSGVIISNVLHMTLLLVHPRKEFVFSLEHHIVDSYVAYDPL